MHESTTAKRGRRQYKKATETQWQIGYDRAFASHHDEIQALMDMDCSDWPYKSYRQLLAEGPNHAGGLAQLAEAEEQAERRNLQEQRPLVKATRLPK